MAAKSQWLYGFKIFPGHNRLIHDKLLKDSTWHKIILHRDNLLDQFLSMKIAKKIGAWTKATENSEHMDKRIIFMRSEFLKFINFQRKYLDQMCSLAAGPTLLLEYSAATGGCLDHIFEFLGVEAMAREDIANGPQKQNSSITKEKVLNFDELVSDLEGTEFARMII